MKNRSNFLRIILNLGHLAPLLSDPIPIRVPLQESHLSVDYLSLSDNRYFVFILHPVDGRICHILYTLHPEKILTLHTAPDYRGKGYGSLLLDSVLEAMKNLGCSYVDLEAQPEIDPMKVGYDEYLKTLDQLVKFYSDHGGRVIERSRWHVLMRFYLN